LIYMEYKTISIDQLEQFNRRDLRPDVIEKLTERIAKGTRPYYKYNPAEMPPDEFDNKDLGSGLPSKQFDRYMKIVENGGNVELVGF